MRKILLPGLVILVFFLVVIYASTFTGFLTASYSSTPAEESCGDGVCEHVEVTISAGESSTFELYGEEHILEFLGWGTAPTRLEKIFIHLDGNAFSIDKDKHYKKSNIDLMYTDYEYQKGETGFIAGIGKDVSIIGFGGNRFSVSGGIDLSEGEYFVIGDEINKFKSELTADDLPDVLESGKLIDANEEEYPYSQKIILGSKEFQNDYLDIGTSATNYFYSNKIVFDKPVNFSDSKLQNKNIEIFGRSYTIQDGSTNSKIILDNEAYSQQVTIAVGENEVVSLLGVEYYVKVLSINQGGTAGLEIGKPGYSYDYKDVTEGMQKTILGLDFYIDVVNVTDGYVNLTLGCPGELTLEDGKAVYLGENEVQGTLVTFTKTDEKITSIEVKVAAESSDAGKIDLTPAGSFTDPIWCKAFRFKILAIGTTQSYMNASFVFGEFDESCPDDCGSCEDSDYGLDYYVKGTGQQCTSEGTCTPRDDECIDSITLREGYCENNVLKSEFYDCLYGCEDGACIEEAPEEAPTCTDSDGGKVYNVKGMCTLDSESETDTCTNGVLEECYCEGNEIKSETYNCPYGCEDGVCMEEVVKTECEQDGGYCTADPCSEGFEEAGFACKTESEKCCVKEVDKSDLLEITTKLEGTKAKIDKAEEQTEALSEYYDSVGDDENADKFSEMSGMFANAKDMVDDITVKINENLDNPGEIRSEVRGDIQELGTYVETIIERGTS